MGPPVLRGEGEEAAVGDAAAVAGVVDRDELGAEGGVDAVGADDEVDGCGGRIGEEEGDFIVFRVL